MHLHGYLYTKSKHEHDEHFISFFCLVCLNYLHIPTAAINGSLIWQKYKNCGLWPVVSTANDLMPWNWLDVLPVCLPPYPATCPHTQLQLGHLADLHQLLHTLTHRRQSQPCKATASSSRAVRVKCLAIFVDNCRSMFCVIDIHIYFK